MRKLVIAGVFLALVGFVLYGQTAAQQPFVVQYIDGSVQVQLKGQSVWKTLRVKDQVPIDATVKVAKGGMIELSREKTVVSLMTEGTYPMAGLVAKARPTSATLVATVAQKVKNVSSEAAGGARAGTTAGVRAGVVLDYLQGGYNLQQKLLDEQAKADAIAAKQMPQDGFEIDNLQFFFYGVRGGYAERPKPRMYEEYRDAVDLGIRALIDRKYEAAIEQLRGAVTAAIFTEETRRAEYLLAVAYVEAGSPIRAWKIISGMNVTPDDLEYNDFLIRKAQVQVDSLQFDDALATLKPLLSPLAEERFGQAACLVAYHAYRGLNRTKEASDVRLKGLAIKTLGADPAGNEVPVETETARILAALE